MSYIYLASPYTHPDLNTQEYRYLEALECLNYLLRERIWAYSPIVHCHDLAKLHDLPTHYDFWRDYNLAMIEGASALYILTMEGWEASRGVKDEYDFARRLPMPVLYINYHNGSYLTHA